jgi:hypothetical protein
MAEIPKPQSQSVQRALLADVPSLRFEAQAIAARGAGNIGSALDRMAQSVARTQEDEVKKEAAQYAIDRPLTLDQWQRIRKNPAELERYFKGQGTVFKETYMAAQATQLSNELQVRLENRFDFLKKALEVDPNLTTEQVTASVKNMIDGAVPAVSSLSPEVGLKFKAAVSLRGASVYEKALDVEQGRIKVEDLQLNTQSIQNMASNVNDQISRLEAIEGPLTKERLAQVQEENLKVAKGFAAKHRDISFYVDAQKAFRQAIFDRVANQVTSNMALDNPEVVQKALQSNNFDVEVKLPDDKTRRINLNAEWNFLTTDEKKELRQQFDSSFKDRHSVMTKSREVAGLTASGKGIAFGENLNEMLAKLSANDPSETMESIQKYIDDNIIEFSKTAQSVKNPEILKNGRAVVTDVFKNRITTFIQTQATDDQISQIRMGRPVVGSPEMSFIFSTKDEAVRADMLRHFLKESKSRNELVASENRKKDGEKKDKVEALVQTIFEKPRNSPEVKKALNDLRRLDSEKWTNITKSFSEGRTKDNPAVVTDLQIKRARGTLTPDDVIKAGPNLTINSFEQYMGSAIASTDKSNRDATLKARNAIGYPEGVEALVNKNAAQIEAANAFRDVQDKFEAKYLDNRRKIGTKDYVQWDANAEMDKLLSGAVNDKKAKVKGDARLRVDSFRSTMQVPSNITDAQLKVEIQKNLAGQPSVIKKKLNSKDAAGYISDLDTLTKP